MNDHEASSGCRIVKFVVSNKIDCEAVEVTAKQGMAYAEKIGAEFHEVSAKNGTNITPMFQDVCFQLNKLSSEMLGESVQTDWNA